MINAVMRGKGWPHTLLIWLYDEHGGYYDHVPPPPAVEPDDVLPHSLAERAAPLHWLWRHSTPGARSARPTPVRTGAGRDAATNQVPPRRRARRPTADTTATAFGYPPPSCRPTPSPVSCPRRSTTTPRLLKLIEEKWNLPSLTRRDAAATAPWDMIDLDAPPAFLDPPDLPAPAHPWPG